MAGISIANIGAGTAPLRTCFIIFCAALKRSTNEFTSETLRRINNQKINVFTFSGRDRIKCNGCRIGIVVVPVEDCLIFRSEVDNWDNKICLSANSAPSLFIFLASPINPLESDGPKSDKRSSLSSSAQSAAEKSSLPFIFAINLLNRLINLHQIREVVVK